LMLNVSVNSLEHSFVGEFKRNKRVDIFIFYPSQSGFDLFSVELVVKEVVRAIKSFHVGILRAQSTAYKNILF
jgi:hypothetical protein